MRISHRFQAYILLSSFIFVSHSTHLTAQSDSNAPKPAAQSGADKRDGQHDFDFEGGSWKIHLKRLLHPMTGSNSWVEFDGTSVTRKVWNGRAWLEEFDVAPM